MATIPDLEPAFDGINYVIRDIADESSFPRISMAIIDFLIRNKYITKQEISQTLNLEEYVQEFLTGAFGTSPGDSQAEQLLEYLLAEKWITPAEVDKVLGKLGEL